MGKIVMPKNSALLEEVEAVLKIYFEAGGWLSNDDYKTRLKAMIGDDQYASSYTKKAQITSYFGFTEWEDITNVRSMRRITNRGKQFYSHLINHDTDGIMEDLLCSLEQVTFGRNNFGCPDSDSDVEPPIVFVRAALDLGYLTYKEYAYILWKLEDCGGNYTDMKKDIVEFRKTDILDLPTEAQKYTDAKPIMVLVRWGLLQEDESATGNKHIIIAPTIKEKYKNRINNLKIYNIDKNVLNDDVSVENMEHTVEWFKLEAQKVASVDDEAEQLYGEFRAKFAPEVLQTLDGVDLLHRMFLNETDKKDSLCYVLEYDKRYGLFGSVAGGSAFKYGLFYHWDKKSWVTGSSRKQQSLTESEAIVVGKRIRDELVRGAEVIRNFGDLNDVKDYADLQAKLYAVMPTTISKAWVMMYFHMIFPDLFPVFYNEEWQKKALDSANIEADENSFIRMGQIALFVKKCGISNVAFSRILHSIESGVSVEYDEPIARPYEFNSTIGGAQNCVIYGTPGCGKSYYVQNTLLKQIGVDTKTNMIRTTFYQDYTNTEFVGQILPKVQADKSVTYEFNPGPFSLALKKAIEQPNAPVALVIEELNRGNAASIFGDIFQLLDRNKDGKSQYSITNVNIQDYLNKCFIDQKVFFDRIYIPANLYIIATMNTSDQNVFTLDTAFKRRWQFEKIRNVFSLTHEYKDFYVPGMENVTWEQLADAINDFIISRGDDLSSENKQIGVYFIEKDCLCEKADECGNEAKKKKFAYKLFEYLWDDVAKFSRDQWFPAEIKSLDKLIDEYMLGTQVLKNVLNK